LREKAKKIAIGIVGGLVLLLGVALLVLPGPAFLVIPAGLAILATEFEWAHRWKERCKTYVHEQREKHRQKKQQKRQAYST
jgi:hypothetical protein